MRFLLPAGLLLLLPGCPATGDKSAGVDTALCQPVAVTSVPAARLVTVVDGGSALAIYCGAAGNYTNTVGLSAPAEVQIAVSHSTPEGETVPLGEFAAGEELVFSLDVADTGDHFSSGGAAQNADNLVHAAVTDRGDGSFFIGFEDQFGGGDTDYDDVLFVVAVDAELVPCEDANGDGDCDSTNE